MENFFESLNSTGIDDIGSEVVPKYNPASIKQTTDFLDNIDASKQHLVFSFLKMKVPSQDDFDQYWEEAKKEFIDYFLENPNLTVHDIDIETFTIPRKGSYSLPKLQNIGSTK
jgi:hypothetical protein